MNAVLRTHVVYTRRLLVLSAGAGSDGSQVWQRQHESIHGDADDAQGCYSLPELPLLYTITKP